MIYSAYYSPKKSCLKHLHEFLVTGNTNTERGSPNTQISEEVKVVDCSRV